MKTMFAVLALAFGAADCPAQTEAPLQEAPKGAQVIGYASVADALAALKAKPGADVTVTEPDGWTVVSEPAPVYSIWSFTPKGHYAHPAVIKRSLKEENGQVRVAMTARCEADKPSCDRLMREFQQLNEKMRQDVQGRMQRP